MRLRSALVGFALHVPVLFGGPDGVAAQADDRFDRMRRAPAGPQRLDVSFGVGTSFSTDWSDQVVLETRDATGARTIRLLLPEVVMAPGPSLAGAVTYWRGPLGVRLHGAFTRACAVAGATRCDDLQGSEGPDRFVTDLDVWTYGLQGVVGLTRGSVARVVRPYVLIGASGVTLDPAEPVPAPGIPEGETTTSGAGDVIVIDGTTDLVLTVDRLGFETRLAVELGGGVDLRLPLGGYGVGLRLELVDQLARSPLGVRITRLGDGLGGGSTVVDVSRPLVHTLRATIGAVIDVGLPVPPPPTVSSAEPVKHTRIDHLSTFRLSFPPFAFH